MNSILHGNFRIELLTDVGGRLERISLQQATQPAPRQPAAAAGGEPPSLLDREDELRRVELAVRAGEPVELVAPCGYGKTALLRQLAATLGQDAARPVAYLRLGTERLDDTLQRLVDAGYTSAQPFKADPEQRTQLLGQLAAVVLLDDVTLGPDDLRQLVASLPRCGLVLAASKPVLGRHGTSVTLAGLTDRAAADLVAGDLGRPLTAAEEVALHDLAEAVEGQPLHLHQAAALAREGGRPLAELARRAARDPQVLDRLSVDALAEHERRVLAVLALAGGALLPRELIATVGDVATVGDSLGLLRRRALVEQHEDRFGLPVCQVAAYRELLSKHLQLGGALGTLGDWLTTRDPSGQAARSAIDGAVNALGFAAERAQWPAVVRLVRAVEPVLTLAGRWEASRQALEHGLAAARELGDQAAEALFSHQLGTLELSLDDLDPARAHLDHAMNLRARLGDHAGAAVSSHNLRQLTAPVAVPRPPVRERPTGRRVRALLDQWPVLASRAAVVGLTFLLGILFLPHGTGRQQPPPATAQAAVGTTAAGGTTTATTAAGGGVVVPPPAVPKPAVADPGAPPPAVADPALADALPPDLKLPGNLTREATSRSGAPVRFAASARDQADGPVPVACTPASGSTFPLGSVPVTCSAVDRAGFASIGGFVVTVGDFTPPSLKLPSDRTAEATSKDGAPVRFAASASDRVDGPVPVTCTPASGSTFPLGATAVSCSAVDAAGLAANGELTVTVHDTKAPILTIPGDLSVTATSADGAKVTYQASAGDAVDGPVTPACSPASGETFPMGATKVRCSATDRAGNAATGGFTVSVAPGPAEPDHTPPDITVPEDMTVEATSPAGAVVTYPASATDRVDGSVPVNCDHPSGDTFPLGTTRLTCTAGDKAGNRASRSFRITVRDSIGPGITPPQDMTVEATSADGAVVTWTVSASDRVDGPVPVACDPPSGSPFPLGKTTTVTCTAKDKAGNQGTATFKVTVGDHTPPRLVLQDLPVEATSGRGAEVTSYPASAVDLVDGPVAVSCPPGPPRRFRLGTTTVACAATDKAGNTATGSFTVTVGDHTKPTLILPEDLTAEAESGRGAPVTYQAAATDAVDGDVPVTCSPRTGDTFPLRKTTVACSATDRAGNTATGAFAVTVRDRTKPTITLPATIRRTIYSGDGTRVDYVASAADRVDGTVPVACTPESGSTFPVGRTRVSCSATDRAGNTATGRFKVVVKLEDVGVNEQRGTPPRAG